MKYIVSAVSSDVELLPAKGDPLLDANAFKMSSNVAAPSETREDVDTSEGALGDGG